MHVPSHYKKYAQCENSIHMSPIGGLSPLLRADGSASYSCDGYSVIGAVNGPLEVQRRDELPEEAAIEVALRPVAGVGGDSEQFFTCKKWQLK